MVEKRLHYNHIKLMDKTNDKLPSKNRPLNLFNIPPYFLRYLSIIQLI